VAAESCLYRNSFVTFCAVSVALLVVGPSILHFHPVYNKAVEDVYEALHQDDQYVLSLKQLSRDTVFSNMVNSIHNKLHNPDYD